MLKFSEKRIGWREVGGGHSDYFVYCYHEKGAAQWETLRGAIFLAVGDRKVISYLYRKDAVLKITLEEKW